MTTTTTPSLPRLARLLTVAAATAAPMLASAASSTIALGSRETYALLAAGLGMIVFMAGRRSGR